MKLVEEVVYKLNGIVDSGQNAYRCYDHTFMIDLESDWLAIYLMINGNYTAKTALDVANQILNHPDFDADGPLIEVSIASHGSHRGLPRRFFPYAHLFSFDTNNHAAFICIEILRSN